MKINSNQLEKIKDFAITQIKNNDSVHGSDHIKRTVIFARIIAKKEKADIIKSEIIAWLHDICKYQEKKREEPW